VVSASNPTFRILAPESFEIRGSSRLHLINRPASARQIATPYAARRSRRSNRREQPKISVCRTPMMLDDL